ncbi:MAG: YbeD family protein [Burkholderiales bacterium]
MSQPPASAPPPAAGAAPAEAHVPSGVQTHPLLLDPPDPRPAAQKDSLIDYPSQFPIKVMGANAEGFVPALVLIARQFDAAFDEASIELRPSKAGNYLGVTLTVTAASRAQLDELYRTLSTHSMVKVVL